MSGEYIRRFIPTCESYGWEGGPGFNTRIVTKANGRERRNADWSQPQHSYSAPFQNITQDQYAPIKQMHLNRRGAWGCFLFRDRLDDVAQNEVFAVADAGQTEFQLSKNASLDGVQYLRTVTALYSPGSDGDAEDSAITITRNGAAFTAFTLDRDTGKVTTDSGMSNGDVLRWSGQFAVWVRFQSDRLPFSIDARSADSFAIVGSVDLLEQPAPDFDLDA